MPADGATAHRRPGRATTRERAGRAAPRWRRDRIGTVGRAGQVIRSRAEPYPAQSRPGRSAEPGRAATSPGHAPALASSIDQPPVLTRFLVVLTDVRPIGATGRDERLEPERRRQVVGATSREAADRIASAFTALGMVRAGRQRVKVLAVGRRVPLQR